MSATPTLEAMTATTAAATAATAAGETRFDLLAEPTGPAAGPDVSHYERSQIRIARAGRPVAVVRAGDPRAAVGHNVALDADNATLLAKVDGRAVVRDGRVCVDPTLEVDGNVDFSTGNIAFPGDVVVTGNVVDLFKLAGAGNITVRGAVEGAEIRAARDLQVDGSIVAKDRGSCVVGGDLRAKFISNAHVDAAGNVLCQAAIAHSTVTSGGFVTVAAGPIIGGKMTAAAGVSCVSLGAQSGVMTVVEAGVDDAFRRDLPDLIASIDAQRQKARKIEQTVQPLLANQKTLTAAQKEKATELLFDAQEMQGRADTAIKALRARHNALLEKSKSEIIVQDTLFQGVVIRFSGLQTRITTAFKGPLKIILKRGNHEPRIVLVDLTSNSTQVLGGESIPDTLAIAMARLQQ